MDTIKELSLKKWFRLTFGVVLIAALSLPAIFRPDPATAYSPVEAQLGSEFNAIENFIIGQKALSTESRDRLRRKLRDAQTALAANQLCQAAALLGEMAAESQGLRQGDFPAPAEELHNLVWRLRSDILSSLPRGRSCDNAPRFRQEPKLEKIASDNRRMQGRVSFGEPLLTTIKIGGELFSKLKIPGVDSEIGSPGAPAVPVFSRLIAVPQGSTAQARFTAVPARTIKLNLYPYQIPRSNRLRRIGDRLSPEPPPPFTKNAEAYARNDFTPAPACSVVPAGKSRDLEMVRLTCAAGQYNPVTDELQLFDSIEFDVQFQGGNGFFLTRKATSPFENTHVYADMVANGEVISQYVKPDDSPGSCVGEELLILTHPDFRPAAEALAQWKTNKGIVTSVFNVNDGPGEPGPDTKEQIDAFIESRYHNCQTRPSYVLLLGDVEYIPTFHVVTKLSDNTGTDHPYAMLADNDQLGAPDFAVGRISVDTLEEATTVVNKIIKYESKPPFNPQFYRKPLMAAQFDCCEMNVEEKGKDQMPFTHKVEERSTRFEWEDPPYEVDRFYVKTVESDYQALAGEGVARRYDTGTPLPMNLQEENGFAWKFPGDTQLFADAINEGRFLVNYNAHGFSYGWGTPWFDTYTNGASIHNGDLLPVIFSVSCSTGMFDNEDANGEELANADYPTLGEWFLLNNSGGAVGFIGSSRTAYVDTAETFMYGLFEAAWPSLYSDVYEPKNRLGDILVSGKLYLWGQVNAFPDSYYSPMDAFYQFNLLGDPTLEMWTRDPYGRILNPAFEYQVEWPRIIVKYPAEGATITAYQETSKGVVPVGRALVHDGQATLPFVNSPVAGVPLRFAANLRNSVGVKLGS
jgi:hypothetical protein